ncbi:hypothetical protein D3C76_1545390 [compost metagenome]
MPAFEQIALGEPTACLAEQFLERRTLLRQAPLQRAHAEAQAMCHGLLVEQTGSDLADDDIAQGRGYGIGIGSRQIALDDFVAAAGQFDIGIG